MAVPLIKALATDYDGTLATDGAVEAEVRAALETYRRNGGFLLLVTGRELPELKRVYGELDLFDRVVAENGGLLYDPRRNKKRRLGPPPPADLVVALKRANIARLSVGEVVVAIRIPHDELAGRLIEAGGWPLRLHYNKREVMILPEGVDKGAGLRIALNDLQLDPAEVAAVGDAENDLSMMALCGLSAAVANALPAVQETADWVLTQPRGAGVREFIERLLRANQSSHASDYPPARPGG